MRKHLNTHLFFTSLVSYMKNYYGILGVSESASPEEIKRAFKRKIVNIHPDKRPASEKKLAEKESIEIMEAYANLMKGKKNNLEEELKNIFSEFGGKRGYD